MEFALQVITQILRIFDLDLIRFKICKHLTKNGECRENKVSKAPSQVILYFPRRWVIDHVTQRQKISKQYLEKIHEFE